MARKLHELECGSPGEDWGEHSRKEKMGARNERSESLASQEVSCHRVRGQEQWRHCARLYFGTPAEGEAHRREQRGSPEVSTHDLLGSSQRLKVEPLSQ